MNRNMATAWNIDICEKNLTNLTPWSKLIVENLIFTQLVQRLPTFMEPEGSLPCAQEPITFLYPEPDGSSPNLPTVFS